jgi:ParB-like chromosome segregation protein Spo0J
MASPGHRGTRGTQAGDARLHLKRSSKDEGRSVEIIATPAPLSRSGRQHGASRLAAREEYNLNREVSPSLKPGSIRRIHIPSEGPRADRAAQQITIVSISSLRPGDSPRLAGESKAHIAELARTYDVLPPILVNQRNMRIIDGMHRLKAAILRGQETIEVEYFDGDTDDAFLWGVQANVKHGLPLSRADRQAAAARIIASHPNMSDRAIADSAGLAAKSVAAIRRRVAGSSTHSTARVGKDGKVRPLDGTEGRRRAAQLLTRNPQASLREVAKHAGISTGTVRDVRLRLEHGMDPALRQPEIGGDSGSRSNGQQSTQIARPTSKSILDKLMRDPALRHNERGRQLLRWLQNNSIGAQEWSAIADAVPAHSAGLVAQLARQYALTWQALAQKLEQKSNSA